MISLLPTMGFEQAAKLPEHGIPGEVARRVIMLEVVHAEIEKSHKLTVGQPSGSLPAAGRCTDTHFDRLWQMGAQRVYGRGSRERGKPALGGLFGHAL
ncbi:MAG: hypothetical protein ACYCT0_10835 [Sulfobacillus sp.]